MINLKAAAIAIALTPVLGAFGVGGAWWLRRASSLSIRNLYLPAGALCPAFRWRGGAAMVAGGAGLDAVVRAMGGGGRGGTSLARGGSRCW